MIKEVITWETADGRQHKTQEAAISHAKYLEESKGISELLVEITQALKLEKTGMSLNNCRMQAKRVLCELIHRRALFTAATKHPRFFNLTINEVKKVSF